MSESIVRLDGDPLVCFRALAVEEKDRPPSSGLYPGQGDSNAAVELGSGGNTLSRVANQAQAPVSMRQTWKLDGHSHGGAAWTARE